ncbi:MAG TPA: transposase [Thermoanaerobaculia bacterium]|nr:transposase [Thermoanaerobaculia bacterium]
MDIPALERRYRSWRGSRGNRLPSAAYPAGQPVHVSFATAHRIPLFAEPAFAEPVFETVRDHPLGLAACLMPDHAHWLLSDAASMIPAVQRFKSWTTRLLRQAGVEGRVWQRSFHDRVIRSDEDLLEVARYIVANPVRAGLVECVEDYPIQVVHPERFP